MEQNTLGQAVCILLPFCSPAIEKELVPWKPDSEEKWCMKCGRTFGVQRRKHHCRLCGDIICEVCSLFVSLSEICE